MLDCAEGQSKPSVLTLFRWRQRGLQAGDRCAFECMFPRPQYSSHRGLTPTFGSKFGFRHDFRFNAAEATPQLCSESDQLLERMLGLIKHCQAERKPADPIIPIRHHMRLC